MPTISLEAFTEFVRQDQEPLSEDQKLFLKECYEIYRKNPMKFHLKEAPECMRMNLSKPS